LGVSFGLQPQHAEELLDSLLRFVYGVSTGEVAYQLKVFLGGEHSIQLVELFHESQVGRRDGSTCELDAACDIGVARSTGESIQKGGLSSSGRTVSSWKGDNDSENE